MASEDIDVKNVVIYYFIPLFGALFVLWFLMKKMKSIRLMIMAWVANRMLKKMHRKLQKEKDKTFSELRNQGSMARRNLQILEIGSGSGMNFKHFPKGAEIVCLDPNPYNEKYIKENLHEINPHVRLRKFVVGFAENMPSVEDGSCDAVVCTLVLCTVRDMQAVLSEVKRILKPDGVFYFIEHVAANQGTFKRRIQNFVNPLWYTVCDHCNINRETWKTIRNTGFSKCLSYKQQILYFETEYKNSYKYSYLMPPIPQRETPLVLPIWGHGQCPYIILYRQVTVPPLSNLEVSDGLYFSDMTQLTKFCHSDPTTPEDIVSIVCPSGTYSPGAPTPGICYLVFRLVGK